MNSQDIAPAIKDRDLQCLDALLDIQADQQTEPGSIKLVFHFGPNEFFSNEVIRPTVAVRCVDCRLTIGSVTDADKSDTFDGWVRDRLVRGPEPHPEGCQGKEGKEGKGHSAVLATGSLLLNTRQRSRSALSFSSSALLRKMPHTFRRRERWQWRCSKKYTTR